MEITRKRKENDNCTVNAPPTSTNPSNNSVSLVHDKSEIDHSSPVNSRSHSSSEETITEHNKNFMLDEENQSSRIDSEHESHSSTEVSENRTSMDTLSEYKHELESKEDNDSSQNDGFPEAKIDIKDAKESLFDIQNKVKTEGGAPGQEKENQVTDKYQTHDSRKKSSSQKGQEVESNKKVTKITEEVIPELNEEPKFQKKMLGEMNTIKVLKKETEDLPKETTVKTFNTHNDEKVKSTTNSSPIEVKDKIGGQESVTEVDSLKEKVALRDFNEENISNTEGLKTTKFSGTSKSDHKEEDLTSNKNLNTRKHSAPFKTRNGGIKKNRRERRHSRIDSFLLKGTREKLDKESSEN